MRRAAETVNHGPMSAGALSAWEACIRSGVHGSIYLHPKLVLSELETYRGSQFWTFHGGGSPDDAPGGIAVLCRKTVKVKVLPRPFRPLRINGYRLAGDQIVASGSAETVAGLVGEITRPVCEREVECLFLEDIEYDSALWKAIHEVAGQRRRQIGLFYPSPPQAHHSIRFPNPPEAYWQKFSSKTRYNLRRAAKQFEHDLLRYGAPADVPSFLEKAHAVSTRSWQAARIGVRIQNNAQEREYWTKIAELGAFRSYVLEHAGAPAAFVVGTCWNGYYTYEEIAYDQAHFRSSPGTVLLYRVLEDLIASDAPTFDFGAGDAEYKQTFSNHETRSGPILLARRPFPAAYLQLQRLSSLSARAARTLAGKTGILTRLRRRSRRASPPSENQ